MRIGIIAPPWGAIPPSAYGGIEEMLDQLARGLERRGHDVVLFTTGESTCPVSRKWIYDVCKPDEIGQSGVEIRHVVHAYEALGSDVDVVHDNTLLGPLYAWRYRDVPVVTTNHGPFDETLEDLYRATAGRVALVAISHHQASTANGIPIEAVIHHGLDPTAFQVGSGGGGYMLFLGRMTPDKGAREAAQIARRAGVRLLMAGKMREPGEHQYYNACVKPLLGGDVEYVGEVSADEKLALLGGAAALVNPIRWPEPFGLVMIEALASGTPVLAFPEGAAPEIVAHGETGYLCDDEAAMTEQLDAVDELDRGACRAAFEQRFSADRMVDDYVQLFERVVAQAAS